MQAATETLCGCGRPANHRGMSAPRYVMRGCPRHITAQGRNWQVVVRQTKFRWE